MTSSTRHTFSAPPRTRPRAVLVLCALVGALWLLQGTAPVRTQATGLVAAYSFDEGTGTTIGDSSGNGNTGTAVSTIWSSPGQFGSALRFDGAGSGVTVQSSSSLNLTSGMTLSAWVYPTSVPSGWRAIIGKNVDRFYLMAGSDGSRPVIGGTFTVGGNRNLYAPNPLQVNTWTHLAGTFDGAALRLYVNGVEVANVAQSGSLLTSADSLTIGRNVYGEYFDGLIDEVRIYNRALTAGEIQLDLGAPVSGGGNGPKLTITQPASGASIDGTTVPVSYSASGDLTQVDHVHFQLDSLPVVMDLDFDGSFQFTNVASGAHQIRGFLVREDHTKIPGTDASVTFTTNVTDPVPPSVSMTSPPSGATLSGAFTVSAAAVDDVGIAGVQFQVDGANAGSEDATSPYSRSLNTTDYGAGAHTLTAIARDVGGNTTVSAPVAVTFSSTSPTDPSVIGQWAAPFDWPIVAVHAALLPTGKILTWTDGSAGSGVQLWNPATNSFTARPYSAINLFCAGQTFLADGRLIATGGHLGNYWGPTNTTLFDPWSESWIPTTHMTYGRWYPTSTRLADGRILTVSGAINCPTCTIPGDPHEGLADIAEIFDPVGSTWVALADAPRRLPMYPHMFLLQDGRIVASSTNEDPIASWVLNLATRTWSQVQGGVLDGGSAAMYAPGKILKSGTAWNPDYPIKNSAATTYVLDMNNPSPAWRQTAPMAFARTEHNLTLLPDGTVLATGGSGDSNVYDLAPAVYEAELWSPATETWKTMAAMSVPRLYHSTALLLPDARVITMGSGTFGINQLSAQVYSPPYLFKGPRPVITSAPGTITLGTTFTVQTPDSARIGAVSLLGLGSVTHAFDANQSYLPLGFQPASGAIQVTLPSNGNLAPPGYYMLFLLDTNGVPSVAAIVKVVAASGNTAPSAPGSLSASASGTQITLTWTAASDDVGVTGYRIERCQGGGCSAFAEIATATGLTYTNSGLNPSTTYSYRVRATDAAGLLGPYSPTATATTGAVSDTIPPSAPASLNAAVNGTDITLTWSASSDNVGVTGYRVERCQGAGCSAFAEIAAATGLTYTNTGLNPSTTYSYRVRATDAAGLFSPYSPTASATTGSSSPPGAGLIAAYGFNEATGSTVTDASGNGNTGTVSGAAWSTAGRFGGALQFDGSSAGVTVSDSASLDLTSGMTLEAWVYPTTTVSNWRAVIGKNVDRYYLMASSDRGAPAAGGTFTNDVNQNIYASSGLSVNTWTHLAATFDGATLRLYVNGNQVSSAAQTGALLTSGDPLTIGYNIYGERFTGLIDEIRIYNRALTQAEVQADRDAPVSGGTGTDTSPPTAPGSLGASASGTQIVLTWTAATDNVGVTGYRIERCQGTGCSAFAQIASATGLTYTDANLNASTSYSYRVRATDAAGLLGPYSPIATATTGAVPDTTPPSAPGSLSAGASGTTIALTWSASTDNVGVTGYRIERCQGAGCSAFTEIATATGLTYTNTGLSPSTSYSYRVRATDGAGLFSPYSPTASATTGSSPQPGAGLVAAYAFDEGAGTTLTDSSGTGNTGNISGATWSTAGRFGGALQFNGSNAGVTVPDSASLDLTSGMTLEAWVYPTVTPANWRGIVGKDVDRYYLMAGSNRKTPAAGGTFAPNSNRNVYAPAALPVNTWTHLAATYDGAVIRLYVNGVEVSSLSIAGTLTTSTGPLTIGHNFYGEYFTGLIDEVRVYNRALTPAEIQTDMSTAIRP